MQRRSAADKVRESRSNPFAGREPPSRKKLKNKAFRVHQAREQAGDSEFTRFQCEHCLANVQALSVEYCSCGRISCFACPAACDSRYFYQVRVLHDRPGHCGGGRLSSSASSTPLLDRPSQTVGVGIGGPTAPPWRRSRATTVPNAIPSNHQTGGTSIGGPSASLRASAKGYVHVQTEGKTGSIGGPSAPEDASSRYRRTAAWCLGACPRGHRCYPYHTDGSVVCTECCNLVLNGHISLTCTHGCAYECCHACRQEQPVVASIDNAKF